MSKRKKITDPRLFGLDLSHHQGVVDWSKIANAGVKFAFLKATEATSFKDKRFVYNRAKCAENAIPCGGYHFFRPQVSDHMKQITNFVSSIGAMRQGELPPVLDLEVPESWKNLSLNQRVKITRQWLDGVEAALDVRPIIYLSTSFANDVLGSQKWLQNYILWLAHYTRAANPRIPEPWKSASEKGWTFWQYSESGTVSGVSGNLVDLNWFNGDDAALKKLRWKTE